MNDKVATWVHDNRATLRLALSYLAIIMTLSIFFSVVFYRTSWNELNRESPPPEIGVLHIRTGYKDVGEFFSDRVSHGETELKKRLVYINLLTLAAGSFLSYMLARRSLEPIEEAMAAQSRFVEDASHELRTPLTALRTKNEVALRKPKLTMPEAKSIIKSNLDEIARLSALAEGLLNLARGGRASNDVTEFQVDEAVSDAINNILSRASVKKIEIKDDVPKLKLKTDKHKLVQIITALLDNATKYSPEGGLIKVNAARQGRQTIIKVTDQGVGIRASDLPHIFDRFYRADNSRSQAHESGYGLGLAIAKELIGQIGGTLEVQSKLDKGATFTIKLPLNS